MGETNPGILAQACNLSSTYGKWRQEAASAQKQVQSQPGQNQEDNKPSKSRKNRGTERAGQFKHRGWKFGAAVEAALHRASSELAEIKVAPGPRVLSKMNFPLMPKEALPCWDRSTHRKQLRPHSTSSLGIAQIFLPQHLP